MSAFPKYTVTDQTGTTIFTIVVESVNYTNADELIWELKNLIKSSYGGLVIDITGVKYFDSTGMNFLTYAEQLQNRKNSRVKLVKSYKPAISSEEVASAFFKAHNS